MSEINRIVKLLTDLQHGDCWIGINFREALHGVHASQASASLRQGTNSIWQLVAHITYWRTVVVNRLEGSLNPPPFPDFKVPDELTEENWKQALIDFESVYHTLRSSMQHFKEGNLDKPSPKEGQTFHQLMMGSLEHDTYHLGQIVLIKKLTEGRK